jgi:hypothetical protein
MEREQYPIQLSPCSFACGVLMVWVIVFDCLQTMMAPLWFFCFHTILAAPYTPLATPAAGNADEEYVAKVSHFINMHPIGEKAFCGVYLCIATACLPQTS